MNNTERWNADKIRTAEEYAAQNRAKPYRGEAMFQDILDEQEIYMDYQVPIYLTDSSGKIERFYIVDFLDELNNIIIEIDGSFHDTPNQKKLDEMRQKDLCSLGYDVYRITNKDISSGRAWKLLYLIYQRYGINIFAKDLKRY